MARDLLAQEHVYTRLSVHPEAQMEDFLHTPNGNGDRFAAMHYGQVLLYSTGRSLVYYSVGKQNRWVCNEGHGAGDVERRSRDVLERMRARARSLTEASAGEDDDKGAALFKWALACDNLPAMQMMTHTACKTYGMVCDPAQDFDSRWDILATPAQILELRKDVQVRDILPSDMVTFSTAVEYRPEILEPEHEPELITQFLETFIPDTDKQRLLFKALGTALLGGNAHRLLIILQGKAGTNGKTQLVEAIRTALGGYAGAGTPSIFRGNLDDKPRPDIVRLLKKRFAFLAEASKNWELHGDRVKAITGGDGIPVRRMRENDFEEVIPQFTPVIYTNDMPRVSGADQALKRRMLVIDFDQRPLVEDTTIKQRFLASQSVQEWLLAALVRGYLQSTTEGVTDVQDAFATLTATAFDETSHLGDFFVWLRDSDQLAILDPVDMEAYGIKSKYVALKTMHERYVYWVKEHGNKQDKNDGLSYTEFNDQLKTNYGWSAVKSGVWRWEGRLLRDYVQVGQA